MEKTNDEALALLKLHCRAFALENLAASYKSNAKALKLNLKLIKIEKKELNKCIEVGSYDIGEISHRYDVLTDIVKRLVKAPTPAAENKALEDLRLLTEKTQEDISELREQLSPLSENVRKLSATIDGAAFNLSRKLESGTKILSDKVSEAVDELKKKFTAVKENDEENK